MSLLNRKFLFVHVNKSGGSIITKHMRENGKTEIKNKHRTLSQMLDIAKKKNINTNALYLFTIVRNPWERMLSMYLFYHPNNYNAPEFFSGNKDIDNDFNKWIKWIYSTQFDAERKHGVINIFKYCFSNQLNWISTKNGNGTTKINENVHIIRYENLENELYTLFNNIMKLKKINLTTKVNSTKHKHYSTYYDMESIELVKKHYSKDIKYFNYSFDFIEL